MAEIAKDWDNLPKEHKLSQFAAALPEILEKTGYAEMYGVELVAPKDEAPAPHTTLLILQKFLRANVDDLEKAKTQLTEALQWRKEYQPLKVKDESFDGDKFGGLGYVTKVKGVKGSPNEEDVVTWNIYGAATKDVKKTFGDVDAWRVGLQEIAISHLNLNEATKTIPDYGKGPDPYRTINVHDYLSVSFLRRPAEIKNSSSKIVQTFQQYYPETVSSKFFVNVPIVMQWMMGAMKALMSSDSIQSMTWMTYGSELHNYLSSDIPKDYGGTAAPLKDAGLEPKYAAVEQKTQNPTVAPTEAVASGTAPPATG
ncbi:Hypothetical predicted protein [Lecanosticta acicola]|uniref:Phosphatidylinositol transfer protein SFH5 n=1 Tax=Lecanosticta acicola TaxID=111012 RepID=A0AAI8YSM9_9PEZI|nr:Hypothetical predicted protein [Lecanosticta acicola]